MEKYICIQTTLKIMIKSKELSLLGIFCLHNNFGELLSVNVILGWPLGHIFVLFGPLVIQGGGGGDVGYPDTVFAGG